MKYKVKVKLNSYDYHEFEINASNEKDAVLSAVKQFANEMNTDASGALVCGAITWAVEPAREWMTAEEGAKVTSPGQYVWAFRNGKIERWHKTTLQNKPYLFVFDRTANVPEDFDDFSNQPSHVMIRIKGEETPAPPVTQPTLYEQVKAICEGDGDAGSNFTNVWSRRQQEICIKHESLWWKAIDKAGKNEIYPGRATRNELSAHILCAYALQIAKES